MADNYQSHFTRRSILIRLILTATVLCIAYSPTMLTAAIIMIICIILSPQHLESLAGGTTHIRLNLDITHNPPPDLPSQRRRYCTHRVSPHSSNQPYTWHHPAIAPHASSPGPTRVPETPFPHANSTNTWTFYQPPRMPTTSQQSNIDPLPPARPGDVFTTPYIVPSSSEDSLPPARPGDEEVWIHQAQPRTVTGPAPSMPPLVFEDGEEPLPVYEGPPEDEDEGRGE